LIIIFYLFNILYYWLSNVFDSSIKCKENAIKKSNYY
jgi:hypothetical protein